MESFILKVLLILSFPLRYLERKFFPVINQKVIALKGYEKCSCGSSKKYQDCCRAYHKKTGCLAVRIITQRRRRTTVKIKVINIDSRQYRKAIGDMHPRGSVTGYVDLTTV